MARWVISMWMDLFGFVLPVVLALVIRAATSSYPAQHVPFFWAFFLETMIDCAHVYATLYRTVFDSEAASQNWRLYLLAAPGLFLVSSVVNLVVGPGVGWSLLAYYAWFHFAKQPLGLICLYKARYGERGATEHKWDYWTCMGASGIPFLLWHAGAFGDFRWFSIDGDSDRRLFALPGICRGPLWVLYVLVPTLWLCRCARSWMAGAPVNSGKLWIMAAHYFTWYMGMTTTLVHNMAFINLFHGLSSMVLVFYVVRRRYAAWRGRSPETMQCRDRFCSAAVTSVWGYGLIVALAAAEASLWDMLVDRQVSPTYGLSLPDLDQVHLAMVTSALQTPQLAHYFLDSYIWKFTSQNPGLKEALLTPPSDTSEKKSS